MTINVTTPSNGQPITVSDLNPRHDGEPRVKDLRVAENLGFAQPRDIRKLIERNLGELETYGVCATVAQTSGPKGGRPTREYWLNEAQALLIAMFSDAEHAPAVRKMLITAYQLWRAGQRVRVKEHTRKLPAPAPSKPKAEPAPSPSLNAAPWGPVGWAAWEGMMARAGRWREMVAEPDALGLAGLYRMAAAEVADRAERIAALEASASSPAPGALMLGWRDGAHYRKRRAAILSCPAAPTSPLDMLVEEMATDLDAARAVLAAYTGPRADAASAAEADERKRRRRFRSRRKGEAG